MLRVPATAAAAILMIATFRVVNAQQIVNIKAAMLHFTEGEVFLGGAKILRPFYLSGRPQP